MWVMPVHNCRHEHYLYQDEAVLESEAHLRQRPSSLKPRLPSEDLALSISVAEVHGVS